MEEFDNIGNVFSRNMCVLIGSFNLFLRQQNKNLLTMYGIEQIITKPTRITDTRKR